MAPNGPEKWGCRMRIWDLLSKIPDLFSKFETYSVIRDYETKKTAGAPEPPSLAPMIMENAKFCRILPELDQCVPEIIKSKF